MIDYYLPDYHFNAIHSIKIKAPKDKIYFNLRHLDFSSSRISYLLFKMRGLKTDKMSLDKMVDRGTFFTIYEKENEEWLIGLLAESFKISDLSKIQQSFIDYDPGKGIKIAWCFFLEHEVKSRVMVTTETRIKCLNKKAKFFFSLYWLLVKPFSGLIRQEMLRILKNRSED